MLGRSIRHNESQCNNAFIASSVQHWCLDKRRDTHTGRGTLLKCSTIQVVLVVRLVTNLRKNHSALFSQAGTKLDPKCVGCITANFYIVLLRKMKPEPIPSGAQIFFSLLRGWDNLWPFTMGSPFCPKKGASYYHLDL